MGGRGRRRGRWRVGGSQCGFSDRLRDLRRGDLTGGWEKCVEQVSRLEGILGSGLTQNCQSCQNFLE